MATWITHLMIADGVLEMLPFLDRHGFCVGNIAPDCNVENADWSSFTPSREVTHWMRGTRKTASDCDAFCREYILSRRETVRSAEHYAFLLGYYSHLITDAAFQAFIREPERVKAVWQRIKKTDLNIDGMEETWDVVKKLVPKAERFRELNALEAEYLRDHPHSGFLTEIMPLKQFPDYIDYLPTGCIVRKIGVMGFIPSPEAGSYEPLSVSREEFLTFVEETTRLVVRKFYEMNLVKEAVR